MNYRHAYHAGNFADVVKHVALVAILQHLRKKDSAFAVIDTHAGRGLYDLNAAEATRTNEAENGIVKVRKGVHAPSLSTLARYLAIVDAEKAGLYPGSPRIIARQLRDQDRLTAIEKQPDEADALAQSLSPFRNAKVVRGDGYRLLSGMLPPPERRGLVLLDPPFESRTEFEDLARAMIGVLRRFSTGICLAWFPVKSEGEGDRFCDELLANQISRLVRVDIDTKPETPRADRLTASAIAVVNPPFGFVEEMEACASVLAPLLGYDGPAQVVVQTLADA